MAWVWAPSRVEGRLGAAVDARLSHRAAGAPWRARSGVRNRARAAVCECECSRSSQDGSVAAHVTAIPARAQRVLEAMLQRGHELTQIRRAHWCESRNGGLCRSAMLIAALWLALSGSASAQVNLGIVHWNDVHARVTPASESGQQLCLEDPYGDPECYGGHARLATVCQQAKADNPNTLCIDAGDEFLGTAWDVVFQGAHNAETLSLVPADVMAVGNHEFDYGVPALASLVSNASFPVIGACNMNLTAEPSLQNVQKWVVVELPDAKVALLGYIAGNTGELSSVGRVTFSDPVEAVPQCVADFMASPDAAGVNIIGLVSHAGLSVDEEVAAVVAGDVDFIISAHSHTKMFPEMQGRCLSFVDGACETSDTSNYPYPQYVSGVPIFQQYFASKYAGVASLSFNEEGSLTNVDAQSVPLGAYYDENGTLVNITENAEVAILISDRFQEVMAFASKKIGTVPAALSAARPDIRVQEMPLGNLICDAMLDALTNVGFNGEPGVPTVCLMNGGGIRAGLAAGDVTYGDVTTVLPFGNTIDVRAVNGSLLRAALEHGVSEVENTADPPGKFAHVGGNLSFVYDVSQPTGQRVVGAFVGCQPLDESSMYQLATNSFVANGGDGYVMLEGAESILSFGPSVADALSDRIASAQENGTSVDPQVEGRIVEAGNSASALCGAVPLPGGAPASVERNGGGHGFGAPSATALVIGCVLGLLRAPW